MVTGFGIAFFTWKYMDIRRFNDRDALAVSRIIEKCFRTLNLGDYSEKCIEGQIRDNSPEQLVERSKNTQYFVAVEGETIIGVGGYDDKKVRTLFVDPQHHRGGIGSSILREILSEARKEGIPRLECWATYYAEDFYKSFGFRRKRQISFPYNGSTLSFVEMEKDL
jgi:N-acetylglutamate synthase-like GNAT family acetyltransferase